MTTSPQLSVIIPTYNRAELLGRTIKSVFQQTFTDYEIIVVDDGSTDCTENSIGRLLKETGVPSERVRYFFQHNQGKSVALNRGLSEARGEWIAFLDSDDLWLPSKIAQQFQVIHQYAPQSLACFTNARHINNPAVRSTAFDRAGKHYRERAGIIPDSLRLVVNPPHGIYMQTILVHSRIMKGVGEFDPALRVVQDSDFLFRLALETQLCYVNLPLVLVDRTPNRREGLIEVLNNVEQQRLDERQRLFEKWHSLEGTLDVDIRKSIRGHLASIYSERGNWLLKQRRFREAWPVISASARARLRPGIAIKWLLAVFLPALARRIVISREHRSHSGYGRVA